MIYLSEALQPLQVITAKINGRLQLEFSRKELWETEVTYEQVSFTFF